MMVEYISSVGTVELSRVESSCDGRVQFRW